MVFAFFCQDLSWAAPVDAVSYIKPAGLQEILRNPGLFNFPDSQVHLEEVYDAGAGKPIVVHIQDPHANFSGQQNLSEILKKLVSDYGLETVMVEGGEGDVTLSPIREAIPEGLCKIKAKSLLMSAEIAGEEYLNLCTNLKMRIVGAEDLPLYFQSIQNYAALAGKREEILSFLSKVSAAAEKIKRKSYPSSLLEYEKVLSSADKNAVTQRIEILSALVGREKLTPYVAISKLATLRQFEAKIDFEKVNLEREALRSSEPEALKKQLSPAQSAQYPNLAAYEEYASQLKQVDFNAVIDEMDSLEQEVYRALLPDDETRMLRAIDRYVGLLNAAYQIRLSSREFSLLLANEPDFSSVQYLGFLNRKLAEAGYFDELLPMDAAIQGARPALDDFYRSVDQRDNAFIKNIESQASSEKPLALIAGGYHTQHLKQLLKEKNYSYIVLSPVVTQETNWNKYEKILLEPLGISSQKSIETIHSGTGNDYQTARLASVVYRAAGERLAELTQNPKRADIENWLAQKRQDASQALGARLASRRTLERSADHHKRIPVFRGEPISLPSTPVKPVSKEVLAARGKIIDAAMAIVFVTEPTSSGRTVKALREAEDLRKDLKSVSGEAWDFVVGAKTSMRKWDTERLNKLQRKLAEEIHYQIKNWSGARLTEELKPIPIWEKIVLVVSALILFTIGVLDLTGQLRKQPSIKSSSENKKLEVPPAAARFLKAYQALPSSQQARVDVVFSTAFNLDLRDGWNEEELSEAMKTGGLILVDGKEQDHTKTAAYLLAAQNFADGVSRFPEPLKEKAKTLLLKRGVNLADGLQVEDILSLENLFLKPDGTPNQDSLKSFMESLSTPGGARLALGTQSYLDQALASVSIGKSDVAFIREHFLKSAYRAVGDYLPAQMDFELDKFLVQAKKVSKDRLISDLDKLHVAAVADAYGITPEEAKKRIDSDSYDDIPNYRIAAKNFLSRLEAHLKQVESLRPFRFGRWLATRAAIVLLVIGLPIGFWNSLPEGIRATVGVYEIHWSAHKSSPYFIADLNASPGWNTFDHMTPVTGLLMIRTHIPDALKAFVDSYHKLAPNDQAIVHEVVQRMTGADLNDGNGFSDTNARLLMAPGSLLGGAGGVGVSAYFAKMIPMKILDLNGLIERYRTLDSTTRAVIREQINTGFQIDLDAGVDPLVLSNIDLINLDRSMGYYLEIIFDSRRFLGRLESLPSEEKEIVVRGIKRIFPEFEAEFSPAYFNLFNKVDGIRILDWSFSSSFNEIQDIELFLEKIEALDLEKREIVSGYLKLNGFEKEIKNPKIAFSSTFGAFLRKNGPMDRMIEEMEEYREFAKRGNAPYRIFREFKRNPGTKEITFETFGTGETESYDSEGNKLPGPMNREDRNFKSGGGFFTETRTYFIPAKLKYDLSDSRSTVSGETTSIIIGHDKPMTLKAAIANENVDLPEGAVFDVYLGETDPTGFEFEAEIQSVDSNVSLGKAQVVMGSESVISIPVTTVGGKNGFRIILKHDPKVHKSGADKIPQKVLRVDYKPKGARLAMTAQEKDSFLKSLKKGEAVVITRKVTDQLQRVYRGEVVEFSHDKTAFNGEQPMVHLVLRGASGRKERSIPVDMIEEIRKIPLSEIPKPIEFMSVEERPFAQEAHAQNPSFYEYCLLIAREIIADPEMDWFREFAEDWDQELAETLMIPEIQALQAQSFKDATTLVKRYLNHNRQVIVERKLTVRAALQDAAAARLALGRVPNGVTPISNRDRLISMGFSTEVVARLDSALGVFNFSVEAPPYNLSLINDKTRKHSVAQGIAYRDLRSGNSQVHKAFVILKSLKKNDSKSIAARLAENEPKKDAFAQRFEVVYGVDKIVKNNLASPQQIKLISPESIKLIARVIMARASKGSGKRIGLDLTPFQLMHKDDGNVRFNGIIEVQLMVTGSAQVRFVDPSPQGGLVGTIEISAQALEKATEENRVFREMDADAVASELERMKAQAASEVALFAEDQRLERLAAKLYQQFSEKAQEPGAQGYHLNKAVYLDIITNKELPAEAVRFYASLESVIRRIAGENIHLRFGVWHEGGTIQGYGVSAQDKFEQLDSSVARVIIGDSQMKNLAVMLKAGFANIPDFEKAGDREIDLIPLVALAVFNIMLARSENAEAHKDLEEQLWKNLRENKATDLYNPIGDTIVRTALKTASLTIQAEIYRQQLGFHKLGRLPLDRLIEGARLTTVSTGIAA